MLDVIALASCSLAFSAAWTRHGALAWQWRCRAAPFSPVLSSCQLLSCIAPRGLNASAAGVQNCGGQFTNSTQAWNFSFISGYIGVHRWLQYMRKRNWTGWKSAWNNWIYKSPTNICKKNPSLCLPSSSWDGRLSTSRHIQGGAGNRIAEKSSGAGLRVV